MKNRQKRVRSYLKFYKHYFQFKAPFQVIIDGSFCQSALKGRVNIKEQLPKYFQEDIRLFTTACVIKDLQDKGNKHYGALHICKQYRLLKCHHKKSIPPGECLFSLVAGGNPRHFFLATTDFDLTQRCREQPGVPVLYIYLNTLVLEKPSQQTTTAQHPEPAALSQELQEQLEAEQPQPAHRHPKKHKTKAPNPLSCLKKKKCAPTQEVVGEGKKKRRTRHRRPNKSSATLIDIP